MSDVNPDALAFLERFAAAAGVPTPSADEVEVLLNLAGAAAHGSHRQAAPVACWLAARAGLTAEAGLALARSLADG